MAINPPGVSGPGIAGPFVTSFLEAMQRARAAQGARRAGGLTEGLQAARLLEALQQRQVRQRGLGAAEALVGGIGAPAAAPTAGTASAPSPTALPLAVGGVPQPPGAEIDEFGPARQPPLARTLGPLTPQQRVDVLTQHPALVTSVVQAQREQDEADDLKEARRLNGLAKTEKDSVKRADLLASAWRRVHTPEGAKNANYYFERAETLRKDHEQHALQDEDMARIRAADAAYDADPTPTTFLGFQKALDAVKSYTFREERNKQAADMLKRRFSPDLQENMAFRWWHREAQALREAGKTPDYAALLARMTKEQPQLEAALAKWFRKAALTSKNLPREFYDAFRWQVPPEGAPKGDRDAARRATKAAHPELDENSLQFLALENAELNRMLRGRKEALVTPEEREYQALRRRVTEKQLGRGDYERLTLVRQRITQEMANIQRFGDPQGADAERYQFLQGEEAYVRAALPLARQAEEAARKVAPKGKAAPKAPAPSGAFVPPKKPAATPPAIPLPTAPAAAPPPTVPHAAAKGDALIAALKARGMTGEQFAALPPEEQRRIIEQPPPVAGRIGTPEPPAVPRAGLSPAAAAQREGERIGEVVTPARGQIGTPTPPTAAPAFVPPGSRPGVRVIPGQPVVPGQLIPGAFDIEVPEVEEPPARRATPPSPVGGLKPTPKAPKKPAPKEPAPKAAKRPVQAPSPDEIERFAYFQWASDNNLEDSPQTRERWEGLSILDKGHYFNIVGAELRRQRLEQAR